MIMNVVEHSKVSLETELLAKGATVNSAKKSEDSCVDLDEHTNDEHETSDSVGRLQSLKDRKSVV